MIVNSAKRALVEGRVTVGTWLALGNTRAAQIVAAGGFDWVVIDTEHGSIGIETVAHIVDAVRATGDTTPIVRVPWNDPMSIKCALDAGAYGVVVPMVNTQEEAVRAIQSSKYPPSGFRSYGGPRVRLYGGVEYFRRANDEIVVILQIEHIDAVSQIDDILSVDGLDAFFIGPSDLAVSMGLAPGETSDARFVE